MKLLSCIFALLVTAQSALTDDRGPCSSYELVGVLHTDGLRAASPRIGLRILRQSKHNRLVLIYDSSGRTMTRAFSIFNESMPKEIRAVHARIVAGGLMGESFRQGGWLVQKKNLDQRMIPLTGEVAKALGLKADPKKLVPIRLYSFDASQGNLRVHYAQVMELDREVFAAENSVTAEGSMNSLREKMLAELLN